MPGHFLIFTSPIVVILCCCAALIDITSGASVEEYKLLQSTLLTNYSTSVRPLLDQDDTVFVYSGFYLAGINEVDAVNQRLITTGFLELSWDDEFLQWDEDEFDIQTLYFKQVWGIVKIQLLLKEQQTHHQKKITYIYCIMEIVVLLLLQTLSSRLISPRQSCVSWEIIWDIDNEDERYKKWGCIFPCIQYGATVLAECIFRYLNSFMCVL